MSDLDIFLFLTSKGLISGAIYALMALGIVVLYSVTGVINVAQGEFVMLAALSAVSLGAAETPGTLYLVMAGLVAWALFDLVLEIRERRWGRAIFRPLTLLAIATLLWALVPQLAALGLPYGAQLLLAVALTTLLGPICYRLIVQPLPRASVLVFFILTIGLHLALSGLGLYFWGPDAYGLDPIQAGTLRLGRVPIQIQGLWVLGVAAAVMLALYLFFAFTLYGKALRAAAVNRLGARLSGIGVVQAGRVSFTISVFLSALAGVLITPITKMVYDLGFTLGLKGFIGAVLGGLVNPALAAVGGLFVGVAEQYGAFYISSAYKDVLVFLLLIPILLLRSLQHQEFEEHVDD